MNRLTKRELAILKLVACGVSRKELCVKLGVSHKSAEHSHDNLYRKLDIHSNVRLAHYALAKGYVKNLYDHPFINISSI